MKTRPFIVSTACLVLATPLASAAITTLADPGYGPQTFATLDPELYGPAARNVAATRQLRQTFQLGETITVEQIVLSLVVQSSGANGGLTLTFYEVHDVNAGSFTAGNQVHSLTIPTTDALPATTATLGIQLSGSDTFTLPQRDTGTQGYAIQVSNADGSTNVGAFRHTNDGTDNFTLGRYYDENGTPGGGGTRDLGIALNVPEPSTFALAGLGLLGVLRRRRA